MKKKETTTVLVSASLVVSADCIVRELREEALGSASKFLRA